MVKPRKLKMELRKTAKERSISFTKRRQGLFSKAANFSMITDAHIALWVTSPCANGKTYSFTSHHSIHHILDSFLQSRLPQPLDDATKVRAKSLWHEINSLESNNSPPSNEHNKGATQGFLEEFENCNSVQVLKDIVERLESMRNGLIARMNLKQTCQSLPSNLCPLSSILDVQPLGLLNHGVGTTTVGAESSGVGIFYDAIPISSMPSFGFCQDVSDINYNVHNYAGDILLPSGFKQETNVGGWSNTNSIISFDQMQNQELFAGQVYQNTELKNENEDNNQVVAAFDYGPGCVKNNFMDNNKFNDGGGSTWNPNMWNLGSDQFDYGNDESLWKNFDGNLNGNLNLPAVPFELEERGKPIYEEWFCLPQF